ncbi:hypothetical protein CHLRE_12g553252v5 [Chlamydomonas reinhardtii]|uniref:Uncharacterized protein n=1 Tax=Chlamydomonas reinhardtii TaxID=3055 RepID=A0A2K3D5Z9_CHLRE|nr:uncharacterized protein CHLRE_12g553252v5 [Chlamydomonas reinhardtii]PNW75962.1 hypothetical protein CHLRE_12g553252v5 [Chlamydomonas reinhardtii]
MGEDSVAVETGRLAQGSVQQSSHPVRSPAAVDAALGQLATGLERQDDVSLAPIAAAAAASEHEHFPDHAGGKAGGRRLQPAARPLVTDSQGSAAPGHPFMGAAADAAVPGQEAGFAAAFEAVEQCIAAAGGAEAPGAHAAEAPGRGPGGSKGATSHGMEGIGAILPSRVPGAAGTAEEEGGVYGGMDPGRHATDARELAAQAPVLT